MGTCFMTLLAAALGVLTLLSGGVSCQSSPFVRTRGSQFVLRGSTFLFNGFNSYWMMHVAADPSQRDKVSQVFKEASAAGLSVCRTWAFSDGVAGALQMSPGTYDEQVFQVSYIYIFLYL